MGLISLILIVVWVVLIIQSVYSFNKGHFYKEEDKVKKHEPEAYRKWIKISSVAIIICSIINIVFSVLDSFSDDFDWKYVVLIVIVVVVLIVLLAITYRKIVKPADKKAGIESDFDKILKENK